MYETPARREATSWRPWGGIQTEADAAAEKERLGRDLAELIRMADFPLEVRPIEAIKSREEAAAIAARDYDVTLVYAAGGATRTLEILTPPSKWHILFLRHNPGPVYLWYEIVHPRYLRKTVDQYGQPGMTVHDVVIDDHAGVLWRLRALSGLKNTLGKRIVAVGGPSGWGGGGSKAPQLARDIWKLDIQTVPYPDLGARIRRARQNDALVKRAHAAAEAYLGHQNVSLETNKDFVRLKNEPLRVSHLDKVCYFSKKTNTCLRKKI